MTNDRYVTIRVSIRWLKALPHLYCAFLAYIALLTVTGDLPGHFGKGWGWIYENGRATWWGVGLAAMATVTSAAVELGRERLRDTMLIAMLATFALFAWKVFKTAETATPGPAIYIVGVSVLAVTMVLFHSIVQKAATETGA